MPWLLHPYLWAAFPIFSLLSSNAPTAVWAEVWTPLGIMLAATLLARVALRPLFRDKHRLGAALAIGLAGFYMYGPVVDFLRARLHSARALNAAETTLVGIFAFAVAAGGLYALWRARRDFAPLTAALNRIAAIAVLLALGNCALASWRMERHEYPVDRYRAQGVRLTCDLAKAPDIYYIILDSYCRIDVMRETFGYDNSAFLEGLRTRRFYVGDQATSNYVATVLSLSSSMNMQHHRGPDILDVYERRGQKLLLPEMIRRNAVAGLLRDCGYEFVTFATGYSATEVRAADRYLEPTFAYTEFMRILVDWTPVRSIFNRIGWIPRELMRGHVMFVLDELARVERHGKPMFVFGHVGAPHTPHVFDAEGRLLNYVPGFRDGYRAEAEYVSRRTLEVIDAIRARQPNSIIIIQGDHGPYSSPGDEWSFERYARDRVSILNAVSLPDAPAEAVFYPTWTPVNTFRILFNRYFGTSLEPLEDASYFTRPYSTNQIVKSLHPRDGGADVITDYDPSR